MERPQEWPFRFKIIVVTVCLVAIGAWAVLVRNLVDWLPVEVTSHFTVAIAALAIGFLLGQRSMR